MWKTIEKWGFDNPTPLTLAAVMSLLWFVISAVASQPGPDEYLGFALTHAVSFMIMWALWALDE